MTAALLLVLSACTGGFGNLRLRITAGNPGGVYDELASRELVRKRFVCSVHARCTDQMLI